MTLSDKIRRTAFTLAVGSIGAGIGYVANDIAEIVGKMRQESAAKEEVQREYRELRTNMANLTNLYIPPFANYPPPDSNVTLYCSGISCAF